MEAGLTRRLNSHEMTPSVLNIPGPPTAGWLVLIGGGEFSFGETEEIDRALLSRMPEGNPRIAFVPTASGSTEYALHLATYFKRLDPSRELVNVPLYRGRDLRREKNLASLREAGCIYVGGGVLSRLLGALRGSLASVAILEALSAGAVVATIGAASTAAGAWVAGTVASSVVEGLGWIPSCAVEAGFVTDNDAHLRQLATLPDVELAVGIPPATALAIAPDRRAEIIGAGLVTVVRRPSAEA